MKESPHRPYRPPGPWSAAQTAAWDAVERVLLPGLGCAPGFDVQLALWAFLLGQPGITLADATWMAMCAGPGAEGYFTRLGGFRAAPEREGHALARDDATPGAGSHGARHD